MCFFFLKQCALLILIRIAFFMCRTCLWIPLEALFDIVFIICGPYIVICLTLLMLTSTFPFLFFHEQSMDTLFDVSASRLAKSDDFVSSTSERVNSGPKKNISSPLT